MGLDKIALGLIVFAVVIISGFLVVVDINEGYDDVNIENIQEHINNVNEQHSMNALMKWVLSDGVTL